MARLILALLLLSSTLRAQTTFLRIYIGGGVDDARSVFQTADSGYVITGWTESGLQDLWLIKTDRHGDTMWTRTYGGEDFDRGYSVIETADRGYVVAGWTRSFGSGGYDAWLLKTDKRGDTVWSRTFGGAQTELASSVVQAEDSGYVFAGFTSSFGSGHEDAWLVKTDQDGDIVWTKAFGNEGWEDARSVSRTEDSGFILAGRTDSHGAGEYDAWLVKTDSAGHVAIAGPNLPTSRSPAPATIISLSRLLSELQQDPTLSLFDASGRAIFNPQSAITNLRCPAGIYFISTPHPASSGIRPLPQGARVRKVLIVD